MRFEIKSAWPRSQFQILLPDATIPVSRRGRLVLSWTWIDGTEYATHVPVYSISRTPHWKIYRGEEVLFSGSMIQPSVRDTILRAALPNLKWICDTEIIVDQPAYCGGTLRLSNGQRLAVWQSGIRVDVVCREDPRHLPIAIGMILARLYEPDSD